MEAEIKIENLKCDGCASTIKKGLMAIDGVMNAEVNLQNSSVKISGTDYCSVDKIKLKLAAMGYPETGSVQGIEKLTANAKSYVSCAIGKFSNK